MKTAMEFIRYQAEEVLIVTGWTAAWAAKVLCDAVDLLLSLGSFVLMFLLLTAAMLW